MEYASDNRFRERSGAVTNRTYRTWRITKLTHKVRFPNRTYRTWRNAKLTHKVQFVMQPSRLSTVGQGPWVLPAMLDIQAAGTGTCPYNELCTGFAKNFTHPFLQLLI